MSAKGTFGPQALFMGLHDDQMKNKKLNINIFKNKLLISIIY